MAGKNVKACVKFKSIIRNQNVKPLLLVRDQLFTS